MDSENEDLEMVHDKFESNTLKYHISKHQLFSCIQIFLQTFWNKNHLKFNLPSCIHQS